MKRVLLIVIAAACLATSASALDRQIDTRTKWEKEHVTTQQWQVFQKRQALSVERRLKRPPAHIHK